MTTTGLSAFETTVQKTNIWLNEIMDETGWDDRHRAYLALRGVLHALRDRLTLEELADFSAQVPMLVRGLLFEGWDPSSEPVKMHRDEFLYMVQEEFTEEPALDAEAITRAVFKVISRHVGEGEIKDVRAILPRDLQDLWEE